MALDGANLRNAHLKRISRVEYEGRFCGDEGLAGDGGDDAIVGGFVGAFEDAAEDAFLAPGLAGGEFLIGCEAGEFGTGAGAAGGAVVFATGAEDEIAAVVGGVVGWAEEFDVIDFSVARGTDGFADGETGLGELGDVLKGQVETVIGDEEEPVATPGDVASDVACTDGFGFPEGRDIADADAVIGMQVGGDDADGGFDAVFASGDAIDMFEGDDEADHAMAAHAQEADVVEEDDTGDAGWVLRFHQQGSDDDFMAPRFANDGAAIGFELVGRNAAQDDAGGFAAGVGVDDGDADHEGQS